MENDLTIQKLNVVLADMHILYQKLRTYHWNVQGPTFNELHSMFQDQYELLFENIDTLAEHIRQLNSFPTQSYKEILEISNLKEDTQRIVTSDNMIQNLIDDNISFLSYLDSNFIKVQNFEDLITQDIIINQYEVNSKMLWFLKSSQHNQKIISKY